MRKPLFVSILFVACLSFSTSSDYGQGRPIPPGVREADKQSNTPIEPPAESKQKAIDPSLLKQEADELARLSAGVPSDLARVAHGQLPKDLADKLKRIEKLAKNLRNHLTP